MRAVRSAAAEPFDDQRRLRNEWQVLIRARLDGLPEATFEARCGRLAGAAGVDPLALWSLLLWNTSVSSDTAARLRVWMRRGMPLPETSAADGGSPADGAVRLAG